MEWSEQFYAWRAGDGCPSCAEGRPQSSSSGERWLTGECCDAYLVRADIQQGLTIAVFRGRHVVEPTELTDREAATYGREVLRLGRAIADAFSAVKLNYDVLGNSVPQLHTHIVPCYADDPPTRVAIPVPGPRSASDAGGSLPGRPLRTPPSAEQRRGRNARLSHA